MTDSLADQLANRLGIPPEEAQQALEEVVGDLREQIEREGEAALPGLGTLRLQSGHFAFEPSQPLAEAVNHRFAGLDPVVLHGAAGKEALEADALDDVPEEFQAAAVAEALREITSASGVKDEDDDDLEDTSADALEEALDVPVEDTDLTDLEDDTEPAEPAEAVVEDVVEAEETVAAAAPEAVAPVVAAPVEAEAIDSVFIEEDPFEAAAAAAAAEAGQKEPATAADLPAATPDEPEYETVDFEDMEPGAAPSFPVEEGEPATASAAEEADALPADEPVAEVEPDWESTPVATEDAPAPLDDATPAPEEEEALHTEQSYEAEIAAHAASVASAKELPRPARTPVPPMPPIPTPVSVAAKRTAADRAPAHAREEEKAPVGMIVGLVVFLAVVAALWFVLSRDGEPEPAAPVVAEERSAPLPAATDTTTGALPAEALAAGTGDEAPAETPAEATAETPAEATPQPEATPPPEPATPLPSSRSIDRAQGGYTVVVGSQGTRPDAEQMMQQMRQRAALNDYPVDVLVGQSGGATRYRVGVGQFTSIEAADQARRRHAAALPQGAWVLRIQPDM